MALDGGSGPMRRVCSRAPSRSRGWRRVAVRASKCDTPRWVVFRDGKGGSAIVAVRGVRDG